MLSETPATQPRGYIEFTASMTWRTKNPDTWPDGTPQTLAPYCTNTIELYEGFVERNDGSGLTEYVGIGSKPLVQAAVDAKVADLSTAAPRRA